MRIMIIFFFIVSTISKIDCAWWSGDGCDGLDRCEWFSWKSWSECSQSCGGGRRYRSRSLCCDTDWDYSTCIDKCNIEDKGSDSADCNTICYHGGSYHRYGCSCTNGYYGTCCNLEKCDNPHLILPTVPDIQLSASCSYGNQATNDHSSARARLNTKYQASPLKRGAWSACKNDNNQYIQVRFNMKNIITAVLTQGRDNAENYNQYVKKFQVMYSTDCPSFAFKRDNEGHKAVYSGNFDTDTVVTHVMQPPVEAPALE